MGLTDNDQKFKNIIIPVNAFDADGKVVLTLQITFYGSRLLTLNPFR